MRLKYYSFLFVFSILFSCQEAPKTTTVDENPKSVPIKTQPQVKTPTDISSSELVQEKPLTAYATQFYTNALWHYEAAVVINNVEKGAAYKGKWIKFKPDNTLETGFYDGPINNGRWTLDEDRNLLTILESGERPTYSEWKIKTSSSSDDIMIWVGTQRFALNNTQIKMLRYGQKPVRATNK